MDTNTTTATSNPTAVAIVKDMLKSNDLSIKLTEETMATQLGELERLTATVKEQLAGGFHIDSRWLSGAAAKVEESIAKRRSLYENKTSLLYVLKAAGGE